MARKWKPVRSLSDIARKSGLSLTTVSKIYSGRGRNHRRPSLESARALARAQDLTLDELYRQLEKAWKQNGVASPGRREASARG